MKSERAAHQAELPNRVSNEVPPPLDRRFAASAIRPVGPACSVSPVTFHLSPFTFHLRAAAPFKMSLNPVEQNEASSSPVSIRPARNSDLGALASLYHALWPEASAAEHCCELSGIMSGNTAMPAINLVAETIDGRVVGFVQVGLRSHANGCDASRPVGFIEGWYVVPDCRRQGSGRSLLTAAEDWAFNQGCKEMASDTQIDNEISQTVHRVLGYDVVDRCVHFRKPL